MRNLHLILRMEKRVTKRVGLFIRFVSGKLLTVFIVLFEVC